MQLEHRFTVPADIDTVWAALMDPERVAPCLPGATLTEYAGTTFTGTVKVKVGPISLLYKGSGEFIETDEDTHRATIKASGKDSRGNGTATATVTVTLSDSGSTTDGEVRTDLAITGKPAQFGRGLISEVGTKILTVFADCLAKKLAPETPTEPAAANTAAPTPPGDSASLNEPAPPGNSASLNQSTSPRDSASLNEPTPPGSAASLGEPTPPGGSALPNAPTPLGKPPSLNQPTPPGKTPSPKQPTPPASTPPPTPSRSAAHTASGDPAPASSSAPTTTDERHPIPEIPTQPTPSRTLRAVPEYEAEPIDLMEIATHSLRKRLLPIAIAAIVAALAVILRRKH